MRLTSQATIKERVTDDDMQAVSSGDSNKEQNVSTKGRQQRVFQKQRQPHQEIGLHGSNTYSLGSVWDRDSRLGRENNKKGAGPDKEIVVITGTSAIAQIWEQSRNLVVNPLEGESQRARLARPKVNCLRAGLAQTELQSVAVELLGVRVASSSLLVLSPKSQGPGSEHYLSVLDDVSKMVKATGCVLLGNRERRGESLMHFYLSLQSSGQN